MFETFLNFSQLKMSFSWRVNPKKDKKIVSKQFADIGDIFEHIRQQHSVNVIARWQIARFLVYGTPCTPSGKMFYLNDLI